jgi:hypothetical protein
MMPDFLIFPLSHVIHLPVLTFKSNDVSSFSLYDNIRVRKLYTLHQEME